MKGSCVNCGRQIYESGGKWYHQSSGGMACGRAAIATPARRTGNDDATAMRSACVEKVLAKADALREQIKDAPAAFVSAVSMAQDVVRDLAKELETLSIEQPKE